MQPTSATFRPSRPAAEPLPLPMPLPADPGSGIDLEQITEGARPALDYLSRAAMIMGFPDPVQEYFGPVVGRWHDLRIQALRWLLAARAMEELAERLTTPLETLDEHWEGRVADSFAEHMGKVGQASESASTAMSAMAEVLATTAEGVQQLVADLVGMLAGGANRVSSAMILPIGGQDHASLQLSELRQYSRSIFEAVRELLQAFAEMCEEIEGGDPFAEVEMAATFPEQTWTFPSEVPTTDVPGDTNGDGKPDKDAKDSDKLPTSGIGGGIGGGGIGGSVGAGSGPSAPPEPGMRTFAAEVGGPGAAASAAPAGTAAAGGGGGAAGGMRGGMMPMGMMGAGMGAGQDQDSKSQSRVTANPTDIFGEPLQTSPPVIGAEDDE